MKKYSKYQQKQRKTCINSAIRVDTSSRDTASAKVKDTLSHPSMLEWLATDPLGLYIGDEISSPSV